LQDAERNAAAAATAVQLAQQLACAVREAGEIALRTFKQPLRQWTKGVSLSPVSEADIAVDTFLRERLGELAPAAGWLSEETEDDPARLEAENVWIVDPIDGTRSYLAGQPDWTIAVALAVGGRPVLASVYAPVSDEMYLAQKGGGATRNGVLIAASTGDRVGGTRVAGPKRHLNWLAEVDASATLTPRIGSLAVRLARVADGELDVAFAGGSSHDWDLAAADLLVHEAGGALTTLTGHVLTYNRSELVHGALVAAGRERHAALIRLVGDRAAELA
jgi:myo-inositol-1(or 4)-monophosphatase